MMECACFDMDGDDYAKVLSDTMPVARKEHVCGECKRTIEPGEKYRKEVSYHLDIFDVAKTCVDCNSFRDEMVCSFYSGQIREMIEQGIYDNYCDISESAIASLTKPAREWVCKIIEKCWEWNEERIRNVW